MTDRPSSLLQEGAAYPSGAAAEQGPAHANYLLEIGATPATAAPMSRHDSPMSRRELRQRDAEALRRPQDQCGNAAAVPLSPAEDRSMDPGGVVGKEHTIKAGVKARLR